MPGDPVRGYLLGLLSAEEAAALEERCFSEEAAFEELLLAEGDLIDDYLDEQLSEGERRAFEDRARERPELQRRVEARRLLTRTLRRRAASIAPSRPAPRPWTRTLLVLATAAAIFLVAYRVTQHRDAVGPDVRPSPMTGAPSTPLPSARPAAPVVLLLGSAGVRGSTRVPTATLEAAATALLLRLPRHAPGPPTVACVVEDVDGGVVFRGPGRAIEIAAGAHLEVELKAAALRGGDYLARCGEDEAFFRVRP